MNHICPSNLLGSKTVWIRSLTGDHGFYGQLAEPRLTLTDNGGYKTNKIQEYRILRQEYLFQRHQQNHAAIQE